ncbi:STYKc [Nesidiocoris tenuis]|uniref:STYKc n=1 Tax=Nesidiocoris tenuis TaxID=355587 RepID=A0ABN7AME1_9HEMI|nr:STYKc [Nesidiocoris tenuis]
MDVLNKFCSTVSSTVSQLSNVLPGNPVTREYEVTGHIASAGPGLFWKVYSGYKKSTKQPASIFVFEKRLVVPQDKDALVETLKRGVAQLTKLRHPQILVVQHPLEESRDCLAFATEPVFASLANILGNKENMPTSNTSVNNYKLYDVEIKYGLLQVGEGMAFLHRDAKILHHNLCPSSIVINEQGAWKIFGFDFAVHNVSTEATPSWKCPPQSMYIHDVATPNWDYLAPECGLTETISAASDMYSLGMLIFTIYTDGKPLFSNRNWEEYKNNMGKLKTVQASQFSQVADGLRILVKMMLNATPELRPDEHDFIKTEFFEDVGVKALNYLDSLFQWDNRQKSHFYKGLPQILDKLPHRVRIHRVVPCLAKEFVNPMMVPFVLPSVFAIAENCTKQEFSSHVLPYLKTVMHIQDPIQVLLLFMQKMNMLLQMTPHEEVKTDILPMLHRALESEAVEIQELCLSVLPTFAQMIEYPQMKNAVLPRIKRLCLSTSCVSVRVNCLVCIGKLIDHLDKWLVLDEVLPFLPQIPSKEPAVLMGILGIYKLVLSSKKMTISKEMMAQKIIPFLMPLAVENFLTLNQFNTIISVIHDMVSRVEAEHRVKLEQLQEQQKSLENNMPGSVNLSANGFTPSELSDFPSMTKGFEAKPFSAFTPESSKLPNSVSKLSLEDKKRIVKESELSKQLTSSTAPLNPQQSVPSKDLHSSLLDGGDFNLGATKVPFPAAIGPPPPPPATNNLKSTLSNSTIYSSNNGGMDFQAKQLDVFSGTAKSNQFGSFMSHTSASATPVAKPLGDFSSLNNFGGAKKFTAPNNNFSSLTSFTGATPDLLAKVGPNMNLNLSQSQSLLGNSQPPIPQQQQQQPNKTKSPTEWGSWASSNLHAPLLPASTPSLAQMVSSPKTLSKDEINDLLS